MKKIETVLRPCKMCGSRVPRPSGNALRKIRKDAGLTLREFARRLSLSAAYLCDVEYERRNCTPRMEAAYLSLASR